MVGVLVCMADVVLVSKLIQEIVLSYALLVDFLRVIKNEKVLDILDIKWKSEVMYMVNDLHQYSFQGLWLDSIEKLFVDNLHNVAKSFLELQNREKQAREEHGNVHKTELFHGTFETKMK